MNNEYILTVTEFIYGILRVEAPNKSKALEKGLEMTKAGDVQWGNSYEALSFIENERPQLAPEVIWRMLREHSYFRKAIIDLKRYAEGVVNERPNIYINSNNSVADHKDLIHMLGNTEKIRTKGLEQDYEPRYDQIAELIDIVRVFVSFIGNQKAHYDSCSVEDQANHIYKYLCKAAEYMQALETDEGEFILLETAGGCSFVDIVKNNDNKPMVFKKRSAAKAYGNNLILPKVVRIR